MLPADNLELLFPDAPPAQLDRARKVVTLLRLVADEGRRASAANVRVTLERARGELEAHTRKRLLGALLDLLRHCLYADAGADSFAWFGEPGSTAQAAWSALEEYREELPWLPAVPAPNESAASVAARLSSAAARLDLASAELELWRARELRSAEGIERGEAAFRELLDRTSEASPAVAAAALCGWIECCLDRGAVRAARQLVEERARLLSSSTRGARLRCWVLLLNDEETAARAAESATSDWSGRIPASLSELREGVAAWLPMLAGKPSSELVFYGVNSGVMPSSARAVRRSCGAALVAAFVLLEGGRHELLDSDLAPALKERLGDWLRAIEGTSSDAISPEHRAIVEARPSVQHRYGLGGPKVTIERAQIRAVAVAPVLEDDGEVAGWLRFEWDHHRVPSSVRLAQLAACWRERILARRAKDAPPLAKANERRSAGEIDWRAPSGDGPCAEVVHTLVGELAMKTVQRRWWAFEVSEGRARWIAAGGGSSAEIRGSGRRALRRALRSAAVVRYDEPNPELSIAADSASGLTLPLVWRGELCGLLAIESIRRKDFPATLAQRWQERLQRGAVDLRIGQFREWHRARFGHDVHFSMGAGASAWIEQVFAAARSRACCTLHGPAGSGKQIVARWLHFERRRPDRPFLVFACGTEERALWHGEAGALHQRAAGGTIVLDELERLSPLGQAYLLAQIDAERSVEQRAEAPRWVVLSQVPLAELVARGSLRPDLCRRLERLQIRIPPLADRRLDLPRMITVLARRFADEERVTAPTFDDEAIAALWRQPWSGNVRELENLVFKVVLLHPGREVHCGDLEDVARRFQFELLRRVVSRNPEPEMVRAALATTANLRGTVNKTRAAMYLGWDPDTLVTRMTELGLFERAGECAATEAREPETNPE